MGAKGIRRTDVVLTDDDLTDIQNAKNISAAQAMGVQSLLYHSRPTVVDKGVPFFRSILNTGHGHILTSGLRRVMSNPRHDVGVANYERFNPEALSVFQQYLVKKISVSAGDEQRPEQRERVGLPFGVREEEEEGNLDEEAYEARLQQQQGGPGALAGANQEGEGDVDIVYLSE
jgi:hypothetical protein